LSLLNHFRYDEVAAGIRIPNENAANVTNAPSGGSGNLGDHVETCVSQYGERAPNFILVDFFNVGPAIEVVDALNGIEPVGRLEVSTEIRPPPLDGSVEVASNQEGSGTEEDTPTETSSSDAAATETSSDEGAATGNPAATQTGADEPAGTSAAAGIAASFYPPSVYFGIALAATSLMLM
jgi:hypothetical protein